MRDNTGSWYTGTVGSSTEQTNSGTKHRRGDKMARKETHRRYTDEEKAAALVVVDFCDGNVQEASRRLGVPWTTLDGWVKGRVNEGVTKVREQKTADLASRFEEIVIQALDLLPEKLESASAAQLATIAAIGTDKLLLLRNQPTAITAHQIAEGDMERRVAQLIDEARRRRDGQMQAEQTAVN